MTVEQLIKLLNEYGEEHGWEQPVLAHVGVQLYKTVDTSRFLSIHTPPIELGCLLTLEEDGSIGSPR